MLAMLVAYDAAGDVIATLDYLVRYDAAGTPIDLVDFAAHEESGGEVTAFWQVGGAAGAKVWPEWLGIRAHDFRVELSGPPGRKQIVALIHRQSGHRRERTSIEAALAAAPLLDGSRDLRAIVGGPDRPITLDDEGRTAPRPERDVP